ncbi:hypothetical protein QM012_009348 [Aureobasidium pullulans]|uniref:Uncharacterized protein n=1 Tax=Aureobasidium pullulans TaxID=5580 RepID=A0ABR0THH5_AURPU
MYSEDQALKYALNLLTEDARGNMNLEHETVDSGESDDSDDSDDCYYSDDEDDEDDEDNEDEHDYDSDDFDDLGDYAGPCFSDDEEDYHEGNNYGNPNSWHESDDENGFFNGIRQVGSYERRW